MGAMNVVRGWVAVALGGLLLAASALLAGGAAAAPPSCSPGSGLDLHAKRLTAAYLQRRPDLRCANLTGADLSGLSLVQQNLGRAVLRNANLTGADLTQADLTEADLTAAHLSGAHLIQVTLTDAVLRDADLSHVDLGQADAQGADFTGADLTDADLTQAHLEHAHLDHAHVGGLKTTQAYLSGTTFTHVRGAQPWDRYLLIGCAVLYVFLVLGAVRTHLRRGTRSKLPQAIFGRMILVIGVHLFAGYVLGQIASATGPPADQTCNGVQCSLGVAAGGWAPFVGFLLIFVGAGISGAARRRPAAAPMGVPVGMPALGASLPAQLAAIRRLAMTSGVPMAGRPVGSPVVPPTVPPAVPPAIPPGGSPVLPSAVPPGSVPVAYPPAGPLVAPPVAPPTGPPPGRVLTPEQSLLPPEVLQLALAGDKRAAARRYRELTGSSRWEAKSVLQGL